MSEEEKQAIEWLEEFSEEEVEPHILLNLIEKQQGKIDKATNYMEKAILGELENEKPFYFLDDEVGQDLLKILKGE